MKKKCEIDDCKNEGSNKQHVFSGKIKVRPSLKPDYPYVCSQHEPKLNKMVREYKKDHKLELNCPWSNIGTVGNTTVLARKKLLDFSGGTFCTIGENLWEVSTEKSNGVYVDQLKDWYLIIPEDKSRHVAYALKLVAGTTVY
jgi:hypothetical protein